MKLFKVLTVLILLAIISSCNNDDDISNQEQQDQNPTAFTENFGNDISRSFLGNIIDTNNNPIENVLVKIGNQTTMTDNNGVFIIQDAPVKERFGYVTAEKTGFIHASRAVVPSEGTNKVTIMMLPETVVGSTTSGIQETIALANGASVSLDGNYIKEDGTSYTGNVNVIMHHLDPVDENMNVQMPGMLYAANAQNEARMLQTFGMLAVELRGDNGENLNLAEDSTAEIKVPLNASLVGTAPATIPLWYFDEVNGYWIEDGQATLIGNEYIGTVSHFSFWNCDIPAEYVDFCVIVNDSDGNPIANSQVALTSINYGTSYGYTNENGETCGVIPSNETLELNIYLYDICSQIPIHTETIGPFNDNTSVSISIIDNPDIISETIIGTFNDCDGNVVTDGYVQLAYGNQLFTEVVSDGNFEINMLRCDIDNTFTITGYDYSNIQQTDLLNYTFTTPLTNLGSLQSCNTIEEFITYQIEGYPTVIQNFNIEGGVDGDYLTVYYGSPNQENWFNLQIDTFNGPNTYTNSYLQINDDVFTMVLENYFEGTSYVTAFSDVGEYIDINFSGLILDENSADEIPINGTIHVLRDF